MQSDFAAMHRCVKSRRRKLRLLAVPHVRSWIKHPDSSISQESDFMHQQHGSFVVLGSTHTCSNCSGVHSIVRRVHVRTNPPLPPPPPPRKTNLRFSLSLTEARFLTNESKANELRQDPLEAILVIFGRRALIFFLFESSWKKMKNDATFVRMRSGDHLGDAKMSKKGTSLRRI